MFVSPQNPCVQILTPSGMELKDDVFEALRSREGKLTNEVDAIVNTKENPSALSSPPQPLPPREDTGRSREPGRGPRPAALAPLSQTPTPEW